MRSERRRKSRGALTGGRALGHECDLVAGGVCWDAASWTYCDSDGATRPLPLRVAKRQPPTTPTQSHRVTSSAKPCPEAAASSMCRDRTTAPTACQVSGHALRNCLRRCLTRDPRNQGALPSSEPGPGLAQLGDSAPDRVLGPGTRVLARTAAGQGETPDRAMSGVGERRHTRARRRPVLGSVEGRDAGLAPEVDQSTNTQERKGPGKPNPF
jgi:hypothetical protein